jgi:hypothetical protein
MEIIHPVHLLRVGLDLGQLEVHDDGLLAAAHHNTGQLSLPALISWCGTKGGT